MHESISEWWKKICRPTASFKEGWTVLTGTIVLIYVTQNLEFSSWPRSFGPKSPHVMFRLKTFQKCHNNNNHNFLFLWPDQALCTGTKSQEKNFHTNGSPFHPYLLGITYCLSRGTNTNSKKRFFRGGYPTQVPTWNLVKFPFRPIDHSYSLDTFYRFSLVKVDTYLWHTYKFDHFQKTIVKHIPSTTRLRSHLHSTTELSRNRTFGFLQKMYVK